MGKNHFTEEQIAFALRQAESGTPVAEVIRKLGISEQTFYRWKKRFAGLGIAELRRPAARSLETVTLRADSDLSGRRAAGQSRRQVRQESATAGCQEGLIRPPTAFICSADPMAVMAAHRWDTAAGRSCIANTSGIRREPRWWNCTHRFSSPAADSYRERPGPAAGTSAPPRAANGSSPRAA